MIIAIDPGKSGGISYQNKHGRIDSFPMPTTQGDIVSLITEIQDIAVIESEPVVVFLEKVGGFIGKKQPGSTMFTFGENYGFLKGVIQTLGMKLELVTPQVWQKELSCGTSKGLTKTQWKNKLKEKAQQLFPSLKVTLKNSDSLLILEYAKRILK